MRTSWQFLYDRLLTTLPVAQARRTANLLVGVSLHPAARSYAGDPQALAELTAQLSKWMGAAAPANVDWTSVVPHTRALSELDATDSTFDDWVEAFQAVDGNRKSLGAYATPSAFASALAEFTFEGCDPQHALRIVDPAAGTGNLLVAAYRTLVGRGCNPLLTLRGLHGVELDPAAREFCILHLWIAAAAPLAEVQHISANILADNALTRDWWSAQEAFDAVIMNPPWESLRQEREDKTSADVRDQTLGRLARTRSGATGLPPLYSAQGRGDRNLVKAFLELAPHLLKESGRLGALIPAAFGSDNGMAELRQLYMNVFALKSWTTFENRDRHFPIDSRYKFGLLFGKREKLGTRQIQIRSFGVEPGEVRSPHIVLSREDLDQIGGRDRMLPELTSETEKSILVQMLSAGCPLFDRGPLGCVQYKREVDLTLGRQDGKFWHVSERPKWDQPQDDLLAACTTPEWVPVLEGRMVGAYDCFQKSYKSGAGRSAQWVANGDRPVSECRPQFVSHPRQPQEGRVALCDVTSATNTRTVLATLVPPTWLCGNTAPVLQFESAVFAEAAVAILNSMVFDWMARRIVSGLHLNKFYLSHFKWPNIDEATVRALSELGRFVSLTAPRGGMGGDIRSTKSSSEDLTRAMVTIEVMVALGFGIDQALMKFMFRPDRDDRRGFWRYFDADPRASKIADLAIDAVGKKISGLAA